jgi:hypothetical protein
MDRAVSREGSCSCRSEVVVEGGTGLRDVKVDTEAVAATAERRLFVAQEEAGSVVAGRSRDCKAEEGHRRAGREECSARAQRAVAACFAAAKGQKWVA